MYRNLFGLKYSDEKVNIQNILALGLVYKGHF